MNLSKWMMALAAAGTLTLSAAEIKSGESVAFLGDSITQQGWGNSFGYVRLCETAFRANKLNVKVYPAGISGHKSNQMLDRLEKDVIAKKPTYMTLSCGVNDVWHGKRGVSPEDYRKNIAEIVDKCQAAGIKVILLTSTMIGEDADNGNNKKLAAYNEFLKELAAQKKCKLVDLNTTMQQQVAEARKTDNKRYNRLTVDGVHMDYPGNLMMAVGVLNALGFTPEELKTAETAFAKLDYNPRVNKLSIPVADYPKLRAKADAAGLSVGDYVTRELNVKIKEMAR